MHGYTHVISQSISSQETTMSCMLCNHVLSSQTNSSTKLTYHALLGPPLCRPKPMPNLLFEHLAPVPYIAQPMPNKNFRASIPLLAPTPHFVEAIN